MLCTYVKNSKIRYRVSFEDLSPNVFKHKIFKNINSKINLYTF